MKRSQLYGVCKDSSKRVYMAAWGDDDCDPVAARLYAARKSVDLTVPQMAKLLGVNRSTVWRWEHGVIESMTEYMVERWAHFTGASAWWIIHGGDIPGRVRYSYFIMVKAVQLSGKLKPLPDSLGLVSNWKQLQKRRREREEQLREDAIDREYDAVARAAALDH